MKYIKTILLIFLVLFSSFVLVSCDKQPVDDTNDIDGITRPDCPNNWPGCPR